MLIQIKEEDVTPVYRQVINQVRDQVATGALKPGEKLPSVRELARFLDINVNTVQKAYRELKQMGIVSIRPARGAVVSHQAVESMGSEENEALLREALLKLLREAQRLGFDKHEVLSVLKGLSP